MKRRAMLAAVSAAFAGCTVGYSNVGQEPETDVNPSSEGSDDVPIRASVDELLLAIEDFEDDDWVRRDTDDENCREFRLKEPDATTILDVCAWVLDDVEEAEEKFETRVERKWKLSRGEPSEVDPPVGVETQVIRDSGAYNAIFRDANAVGSVEYVLDFNGPPNPDEYPDADDVLQYAKLMHEKWRD